MTVIQHRRGSTAQWAASSYTLEAGEIGIETVSDVDPTVVGAKIGDGVSLWASLSYVGSGIGGLQNIVEDLTPQLGGDLDTNGFDVTNTNALTFDTTPTGVPTAQGVLSWNSVDKTLDLQSDGITYQLGQELAQNVKRFDSSGLENGKVVYITGSNGANILVDYALATGDPTSSNTFGVMTASASGGASAPATTFGLVRDINTSALTEGATVWLSGATAGDMTTTKPAAPIHAVRVGVCIRSHATEGVVFVNVQNGFEVDELHDALIDAKESIADNEVLAFDSESQLWKNQTAAEAGLATPTNLALLVPTGTIQMYAGSTVPNSGWLICDGSVVSQTTYASLYAVTGATYNTGGEGAGNFRLPDFRGRVPVGVDSAGLRNPSFNLLGQANGASTRGIVPENLPPHTHGGSTSSTGDHTHTYSGTTSADSHTHTVPNRTVVPGSSAGNVFESWSSGNTTSRTHTTSSDTHDHTFSGTTSGSSTGNHSHTFTTDSGSGLFGTHFDIRQPYLVLNYIIKT